MVYKRKIKKCIYYKDITICFAFFANFAVPYIKEITVLYILNSLIKALSAIYMCLVLIRNKAHLSNMAKLLLLYGLIISLTTMLKNGPGYITSAITIISAVALVEYSARYAADLISDAMFCNEVIVYWNLLAMFIYPDGMFGGEYRAYTFVLGIDNSHMRWLLPAQVIAILFYKENKKILRTLALTSAITISILMRFSATTILSFVCFWVVVLVPIVKQKINIWISSIGYSFVCFFIVVVQRFDDMGWLIIDVLHKDMTFTYRNMTWKRTLIALKDSWIFGYGNVSTEECYRMIGDVYAHNLLLQLMFVGGIVVLIVFLCMLIELNKNAIASGGSVRIVTNAFVVGLLVSGITEYHFYAPSYILFMILANYKKLENRKGVVRSEDKTGKKDGIYVKRKIYLPRSWL